ncbi:hypothetical protein [Devosia ginsengisoli]|uniref:hypothetical protein n=1 Tax=Devosia ginsengisoli TaxID=400770 RepID=UPI0026EEE40D|nr:hypothetical protein [Devosia ginsengisoli]MCR6670926.1 hypothetical protein [Devosia ginsengisoli]
MAIADDLETQRHGRLKIRAQIDGNNALRADGYVIGAQRRRYGPRRLLGLRAACQRRAQQGRTCQGKAAAIEMHGH